jgi:hypothetical protein
MFLSIGAYAQKNIIVGSPQAQSEVTLQSYADSVTGVAHILICNKGLVGGDTGYSGAYISTDNGATWTGDSTLFYDGNDTWSAQDRRNGYLYHIVLDSVIHSTDGGATWPYYYKKAYSLNWSCDTCPQLVTKHNSPSNGSDDICMAVDNSNKNTQGYVYLAYFASGWDSTATPPFTMVDSQGTGGIWFSRSVNNGGTFSVPQALNESDAANFADCYDPYIVVDGNGVIYLFYTWREGSGARALAMTVSTNGGNSWSSSVQHIYFTTEIPAGYRAISAAASPKIGSGLVALAYEPQQTDNGVETESDSIGIIWTTNQGTSWTACTHVGAGNHPQMPVIRLDSLGNMFVAYYGSADGITYKNIYLDVSTNSGSSWSEIVVNDTPFNIVANSVYNGCSSGYNSGLSVCHTGAYFGLAPLTDSTVGVAWSDNRSGGYRVYFASVPFTGVQFRNNFAGAYGYNLMYYKQSSPTSVDTVKSGTINTLTLSTNYVAHPDTIRHDAAFGGTRGFEQYEWNNSFTATSFSNTFSVATAKLSSQESEYTQLDTVRTSNNLEGADTGSLWWTVSNNTGGLPTTSITSPFMLDTALQTADLGHPVRYYDFKAPDSLSAYGAEWWFEQWSTGDTGKTLSNVVVISDTNLSAIYHGHMRSGVPLYWNNQRLFAWDSSWSAGTGRYWFVYNSHGNIYMTHSTDYGYTPAGCSWSNETRINNDYGHCLYPSIARLPAHTNPYVPNRLLVAWEDTTTTNDTTTRVVMYSIFDSTGAVWSGKSNQPLQSVKSTLPCAASLCPVMKNDLNINYGDAVVVWADGQSDSLSIAVVGAGTGINGGYVSVPNSYGGQFPAIVPGFIRPDTSALGDPVDFELTWNDTVGIKYSYLLLNTVTNSRSVGHIFQYSTPETIAKNIPNNTGGYTVQYQHASLANDTLAEPVVSFEKLVTHPELANNGGISAALISYELGIVTCAKARHDSVWGGMREVTKFQIYDEGGTPVAYINQPSITTYKDDPAHYHVYYHVNNTNDSIQFVNSSIQRVYGDSSFRTLTDVAMGRTPMLPYNQSTPVAQDRQIWAKDTLTMEILKRNNCTAPDNQIANKGWDYNQTMVRWNDTAFFDFISGEYSVLDASGNATPVHQQQLNMSTGIHSINDAANQLCSQYFHITADTVRFVKYSLPIMFDTTSSFQALGTTRILRFKTELRDSATGSLLQTLGQVNVSGVSPHFSGVTGTGIDTVKILHQSGKTGYIRLKVDTTNAPTSVSVTPIQMVSIDRVSSKVASDSDGLGKEIHYVGRAGFVPTPQNPILLQVAPNPFRDQASVFFTIPNVEDAQNTTEVIVMDMRGRIVATLAKDQLTLGRHSVTFNAANLPSGQYVVAVHTQTNMQSKLMILEK